MTDRRLLRPSVGYLRNCGRYLLDAEDMAEFLQIPRAAAQQLAWTGRIPTPLTIGGSLIRWSVLELAKWVQDGCPGRTA